MCQTCRTLHSSRAHIRTVGLISATATGWRRTGYRGQRATVLCLLGTGQNHRGALMTPDAGCAKEPPAFPSEHLSCARQTSQQHASKPAAGKPHLQFAVSVSEPANVWPTQLQRGYRRTHLDPQPNRPLLGLYAQLVHRHRNVALLLSAPQQAVSAPDCMRPSVPATHGRLLQCHAPCRHAALAEGMPLWSYTFRP